MFKQLPAVLFLLFSLWLSMGGSIHAATIQLPQTGQTTCYDTASATIACAGTGQDGDKQAGVAWPDPRFTDNNNGTVTDNLTGLVWLKNANCTDTVGGISKSSGYLTWNNAITWSNGLASGACGLSDGSTAGQWRLPSINELKSLLNLQQSNPATWLNAQKISSVQSSSYWSSSTGAGSTGYAWSVGMGGGGVDSNNKSFNVYVWPVRGGQ